MEVILYRSGMIVHILRFESPHVLGSGTLDAQSHCKECHNHRCNKLAINSLWLNRNMPSYPVI